MPKKRHHNKKKATKQTFDLTLIILNYNTQFWLKKTLTSLAEHPLDSTTFKIKTVVVDNNSQDDSVAMVKEFFPWVELIELEENKGFSAGNNVAIRKSSQSSRYLMLLNSDVEATELTDFDVLISFMDQHPEVGVLTPAIRLVSGELDPACHRGEPTLWASATYFAGLEKLFPSSPVFGQYHQRYLDISQPHVIDACSGAAMLVRSEALSTVGYLDEQFFMYAEDLDWCKRFRESGLSVVFHPGSEILHHKYKSGLKSSNTSLAKKTSSHFYDTMLQYYDKHYQKNHPGFVRFVLQLLLSIKKGV